MSQAQIDSVLPTGVDGQYIQGAALANAKDNVEPYWLAPLGVRRHLPLLIFLPGLDGSGLLIWSQLEELSPFYDVRCLAIPPADRSTYEQLAARINAEIEAERAARGDLRGMPVTVAGESFSGPLALMVSLGGPSNSIHSSMPLSVLFIEYPVNNGVLPRPLPRPLPLITHPPHTYELPPP